MKNKILKVILTIVILGMLLIIIAKRYMYIEEGTLIVKNAIIQPYSCEIHNDYVVLTQYLGEEENVVIPHEIFGKPITTIGYECFADNKKIVTVELNENITTIDTRAFASCSKLVEVKNGKNVEIINNTAFSSDSELQRVEVGKCIQTIGTGAFRKCGKLKFLEEQNNMKNIGQLAFNDAGINEFIFNKDAEIGSGAFNRTEWIQNQPEEFVIYGDGNLVGYNGTDKTIVIPKEVKRINGGAFEKISNVEIYVPETVTEIGDLVFIEGENIRIYIPDTVTRVGDEQENGYTIVNDNAEVTIITTAGSIAEAHAIKYEIPYEIVEEW